MSNTKAVSEADSDAALAALVAADNALFIADVDQQITDAIAQGRYQVSSTTFGYVKAKDMFEYYNGLGYQVFLPDLPMSQPFQPAELFGEFWVDFWNHKLFPRHSKNPVRMIIAWNP